MAEKKNWSEENNEENEEIEVNTGSESEERASEEGAQDSAQAMSQEELERLCRENVCVNCPEKQTMDQEVLRVKADADNFRKRMSKEKEQYCKFATEELLQDIIPVVDNLELALKHGQQVEACKDLVQGVDMTIKVMLDTLKKHGLEPVEVEPGQDFDPTWSEAMAEEEREDMESGQVCQVMQKGYKLKDRLLRPAKVIVSKKCEN